MWGTKIMMAQGQYILNHNLQYNKDNIEKILYGSTGKNIEVLLSHANTHENNIPHIPVTNELVERIHTYLATQKETVASELIQNSKYYLVINCNQNEMVDMAYLVHLHNINQYQYWQADIIPLTHYAHVMNAWCYIYKTIVDAEVNLQGPKMYNDTNISETHASKIVEHVKLRIEYACLCSSNFHQYKKVLTDLYDQDVKCLELKHKVTLTKLFNDALDHLHSAYSDLSLYGENSNYDYIGD